MQESVTAAEQEPRRTKRFFRQLDQLLAEIDTAGPKENVLRVALHRLVETFGPELKIKDGRIYAREGDELVLRESLGMADQKLIGLRIPVSYRAFELLFEHQSFLFDGTTDGLDAELESKLGGPQSAAIVVGRTKDYVLAFGLLPGWERDRLELSINAIRQTLNSRIFRYSVESDFREARNVQESLFPDEFPALAGFDFAVRFAPAEAVGGDFYDALDLVPDERVGLLIGDASGHGLPAALLVRDVVTGLRMAAYWDFKIEMILRHLNRVIHQSRLTTRFVSLFYGELEWNGNFFYVNAGHPAPLLVNARGLEELSLGGSVLGPLRDQRFKRGFAHLDKGGVLVFFTDGLTERESGGRMFGEGPLTEYVMAHKDAPADELAGGLLAAARAFGAHTPFADDVAVMVVRRKR